MRGFAIMFGCPFYGRRWPERSPILREVGGNECGLDFEHNQPCVMEAQGRHVDYYSCPRAMDKQGLLEAGRHLIGFEMIDGQARFLADWEQWCRR
jgi:hypothetical protein